MNCSLPRATLHLGCIRRLIGQAEIPFALWRGLSRAPKEPRFPLSNRLKIQQCSLRLARLDLSRFFAAPSGKRSSRRDGPIRGSNNQDECPGPYVGFYISLDSRRDREQIWLVIGGVPLINRVRQITCCGRSSNRLMPVLGSHVGVKGGIGVLSWRSAKLDTRKQLGHGPPSL